MNAIDVIRNIRKERKYTQSDMAKILGIRQTTYSDIENKRIQLKADDLIKLCCFLGITFDAFISDIGNKTITLSKEEVESINSIYKKIVK